MPFKLKDIEADEVSFVEAGANKRKFLFKKADETNYTITGGYIVCPECDEREAIADFVKSAEEECSHCGTNLIDSDAEVIFEGEETMEELLKTLVKFIGEDELDEDEFEEIEKQAKKLPEDAVKALKGALSILNKYKAKFPDDIKKAIDVLAKASAGGYGYPAKALDAEALKKAGAKLSKATLDIIKKVVSSGKDHDKSIKALEAFLKNTIKKGEGVEELEEKMEELIQKIDKLESGGGETEEEEVEDEETEEEEVEDEEKEKIKKKKKEKKSTAGKLAELLENLSERLEKVEKKKGIKKSLTGTEEEVEDESEDEETEVIDDKTGKVKKQKTHRWGFTIAKKPD